MYKTERIRLLEALDDHGACTTTAITDSSTTELTLL